MLKQEYCTTASCLQRLTILSTILFSMTWDVSEGTETGWSCTTLRLASSTCGHFDRTLSMPCLPAACLWGMMKCCFLLGIFCNNNLKTGAYGHLLFTSFMCLQTDTWPKQCPVTRKLKIIQNTADLQEPKSRYFMNTLFCFFVFNQLKHSTSLNMDNCNSRSHEIHHWLVKEDLKENCGKRGVSREWTHGNVWLSLSCAPNDHNIVVHI